MDRVVLRDTLELWGEGRLDVADAYLGALAGKARVDRLALPWVCC
ncbi:MAG: hypothetical protein KatS3mg014_1646 [Actinomycetota bacterium]|nr:MAG: hypothetical protein KatS3mg014_1646 [Actinomycetota bacterium]